MDHGCGHPPTLILLRAIRRYYARLDAAILGSRDRRLQFRSYAPPVALLPIQRWDRLARKALNFAMRVSHDVYALHLVALEGPDALSEESREEHIARLRRDWERYVAEPARRRGLKSPELLIEDSPYRSLIAPLLRTVFDLTKRFPGRPVMVVMPEVVEGRWWEMFLHTRRAQYLRRALLRHGGTNIVVATVPWQTAEPEPEEILAEEEPEPVPPEPPASAATAGAR